MSYRLSALVGVAVLGTALLAGVMPASAAQRDVSGALAAAQSGAYPGESYAQYYGPGYRRGYYGRGGYYGRRRGYGGAAVGAGIAGLAAGAILGGAIASSQAGPLPPGTPVGNVYGHDPRDVNYCASRYRSYDPASGTFLANDGLRYSCP